MFYDVIVDWNNFTVETDVCRMSFSKMEVRSAPIHHCSEKLVDSSHDNILYPYSVRYSLNKDFCSERSYASRAVITSFVNKSIKASSINLHPIFFPVCIT